MASDLAQTMRCEQTRQLHLLLGQNEERDMSGFAGVGVFYLIESELMSVWRTSLIQEGWQKGFVGI